MKGLGRWIICILLYFVWLLLKKRKYHIKTWLQGSEAYGWWYTLLVYGFAHVPPWPGGEERGQDWNGKLGHPFHSYPTKTARGGFDVARHVQTDTWSSTSTQAGMIWRRKAGQRHSSDYRASSGIDIDKQAFQLQAESLSTALPLLTGERRKKKQVLNNTPTRSSRDTAFSNSRGECETPPQDESLEKKGGGGV